MVNVRKYSDILEIRNLKFTYPAFLLFINFILIPLWVVSANRYLVIFSLLLYIFTFILLLKIGVYLNSKEPLLKLEEKNSKEILLNYNKRNSNYVFIFLSFLFTLAFFGKYLIYPIMAGGDESSQVRQVFYFYLYFPIIFGFNPSSNSTTIFRPVFIVLIIVIIIIINKLIIKISFFQNYSLTKFFKLLFILFISLNGIFFLFIDVVFPTSYRLHIVYIRFGPIKTIFALILLSFFGMHIWLLKIVTISFLALTLNMSYLLVIDIIEDYFNLKIEFTQRLLLFLVLASYILVNPVMRDYGGQFYEVTGEIFFFIYAIRYVLKYIKSRNENYLFHYSLALSLGILYRRTLLFLIIPSSIFLILLNHKNILSTIKLILNKKSVHIRLNNILFIYYLFIPILFSFFWILVLKTTIWDEYGRNFDISRLSLNPNDPFTLYDYFFILMDIGGSIIFFIFIVFSITININKINRVKMAFILFSSIFWYIFMSIDGDWYVRVARFMAPIFVLIYIFGISAIFIVTIELSKKILYVATHKKKHLIQTLLLILIITPVAMIDIYHIKDVETDTDIDLLLYPYKEVSEYFSTNQIGENVFKPWRGGDPMKFYSIEYQLSQNFINLLWAEKSDQNIETLVDFFINNSITILMVPQPSSPFVNREYIFWEGMGEQLFTNQTSFTLLVEYTLKENSFFIWKLNSAVN